MAEQVSFASDGDIILAFSNRVTTRVSSTILCLASPVFKVMLGPDYKEGQASRSSQNPKKIELPEDDADAVIGLSALLHLKKVDKASSYWQYFDDPAKLAGIATVADKYECADAIFQWQPKRS